MSVLYLSSLGPDTKTYLLTEYMNTDDAFEALRDWPVDLDRNQRKEFKTKERMLFYLAKHRQQLNSNIMTVEEEIAFYTDIIDVIILWTYDSIKESKFSKVWRMVVAYQKIITAKEDLGIERALGTLFYANGGFPNQDLYENYNRKVNAFRSSYGSARLYSDYVDFISEYDSSTNERNLSDTIYDFRYEIQHSGLTLGGSGNRSLLKAQWWFDNVTMLLDLMLDLQGTIGAASLLRLDEQIEDTVTRMAVYIAILVLVIGVCPTIVYLTENMTSNIQRYGLHLTSAKVKGVSKDAKTSSQVE